MGDIHNPHDTFFRSAMAYTHVAEDFFKTHLDPALTADCHWRTLRMQPSAFVDRDSQTLVSDILYQIECKQGDSPEVAEPTTPVYILAEHQSTVDPSMPLRMYCYKGAIWSQYAKQSSENPFLLPEIISLVFYNGRGRYRGPRRMQDLMVRGKRGREVDGDPAFIVLNTCDIPSETLDKGGISRLFVHAMKHIYRPWREYLDDFVKYIPESHAEESDPMMTEYARSGMQYILDNQKTESDQAELAAALKAQAYKKGGLAQAAVDVLTAEYKDGWLAEGRAEGRAEGKVQEARERLLHMLRLKFKTIPNAIEQQVQEAPLADLHRWMDACLFSPSIAKIFIEK